MRDIRWERQISQSFRLIEVRLSCESSIQFTARYYNIVLYVYDITHIYNSIWKSFNMII